MRKIISITTAILISGTAYAGNVESINAIYDGKQFEIDISASQTCKVIPEATRGKEIKVKLEDCTVSKLYNIGKRGNFVESAIIKPYNKGSLIDLSLLKKGELKVVQNGKQIKLIVKPADYVVPKFNTVRLKSGEKLIISLPKQPQKIEYSKSRNFVSVTVYGLKLKEGLYKVPSQSIESIQIQNSKNTSQIKVKVNAKAVEVNVGNNTISIVAFSIPEKKTYDKLAAKEDKTLKLTLKFTNADVRSVIKAIASAAGFNVVFDPEVKGTVNIDFSKPVPWKEALKAVLEPLNLTYIQAEDYIRILPKKKIIVQRKLEPVNSYIIKLQYVDAEKIAKKLNELFKFSNKEKIVTIPATNSLILNVTETHYKEIASVVKDIDRPEKQVMIKAKIIQIQSNAEKQLGFSWYISGFSHLGTPPATGLAGSYGFNTSGYNALISPDALSSSTPFANVPVGDSTLALGILNPSQTLRVELALKALEIDGGVQILSSPKVMTLNNQEASIEQGIEIPYTESTSTSAGTTTTVSFKKASLILKVKPHITGDNNIIMNIEVRKDSPNYEYTAITGNNEPAIDTRNVKSVVRIKNGDTVVIGGIYEKEKMKSSSRVPVLSRIPLLGWLFRSTDVQVKNTKLLIFITPEIIK
ncbi:type IV pilus assembly protein PilQ [Desulfurobacterium pacificum]|uniref:Type IV pilus assembly protein PilQ n=1 Tax=Desulfurobacterium pacificum TaxID=240166 RepID=A0ABY1NA80_9BACT|nr:type IV pilus secretin PilQ [Desulfurobacterium pacificum]SMP04606.1 type IV pilus assembly protein PilQ [Desulfurobacterium pacificum]